MLILWSILENSNDVNAFYYQTNKMRVSMFDKSLYMHIFVMCLCVGNPLLSLNCKLASFGHPHDLMSIEKKKNKNTSQTHDSLLADA